MASDTAAVADPQPAPHFPSWPEPARVAGDPALGRGYAEPAIDWERTEGYQGARNVDQGPETVFAGRLNDESATTRVVPPASMFDAPDSIVADDARRYDLTVTNPQGFADVPQSGAGYVLVSEPGAVLAQFSSPIPNATWSPQTGRPIATTIDGAPLPSGE